jgi:hypothetical protein
MARRDEEEYSELQVQQMLEAADRGEETPFQPLSEPEPEPASPLRRGEIVTGVFHPLDLADINSKIVMTDQGAVLGTPQGATLLPMGDPAHLLPVGARIRKLAEDKFVGEQLSPAKERPVLECISALEAIEKFVPHFHG